MTRMTRGAIAWPGLVPAEATGGWRDHRPVHRRRAAPCHGACPAGEDPQAYLARVQEGDLRGAWEILVAVNPLPAVTGRVCPHPCETACNRGRLDAPIAVHALERFLGDEALRRGWMAEPPPLAAHAPRVAVVGAGPAGITAAWHLRRHGIAVTVFDREPQAGGLLRSAIGDHRLPKPVLDAELERCIAEGLTFEPRRRLGRDVHLDELERDYAAVFLAVGCHRPRPWSVDGATPGDLHHGLDLLAEWANVGALPVRGRKAFVHGGGNTAVDVARLLKWAGAQEVHVVTASALPDDNDAEPGDRMAALPREVAHAREEGVVFHPHHTITHLTLHEGRVVAVELSALRKLAGADGRPRRVAFEGTEQVLEADLVVPALGEIVDAEGLEALVAASGFVTVDDRWRVPGRARVFAGGDMTGNCGLVSKAIGDGRRAAAAIAAFVAGRAPAPEHAVEPIGLDAMHTGYFPPAPREAPAVLPVGARGPDTEIEGGLDAGRVAREAGRCMSCGDCLACDNCWTFCPDSAVLKTRERAADGSHYVFDYEFCKGCGVCARECPTGFIAMIEEPLDGAGGP